MRSRVQRPDSTPETAPEPRRRPRSGIAVLDLQRTAGNAAVAQLVQRAPKPKAPPKPKPKPKAKPKRELSETELGWNYGKVMGAAGDARKGGDLLYAAALYERAYDMKRLREVAHYLYVVYKELKYDEESQYWLDVSNGVKKHPLAPEFQHA